LAWITQAVLDGRVGFQPLVGRNILIFPSAAWLSIDICSRIGLYTSMTTSIFRNDLLFFLFIGYPGRIKMPLLWYGIALNYAPYIQSKNMPNLGIMIMNV
jgi:hypothetical protein